ncbi:MAG: hypothetical protein KF906_09955 [Actinobacteria bacterium]|nr:hypothetical protein [Actinomycetota bacterium]
MAAPTPNAPVPPKSGGLIPPEWSAQAADKVIDTVALVRDKTTRPAQVAARGIVYGLVLAVLGVAVGVLFLVMVVRMWSNWVPGDVWILYALLFALFSGAGITFLKKANKPAPATD